MHDPERMIRMNPIVTSVIPLPSSSTTTFYKSVPSAYQPDSSTLNNPVPIFSVTEDTTAETPEAQAAGNWRGGWAKRFIPEQIKYETAVETRVDGMRSLTHAAMGVSSMTLWVVKEENGQVVVEKEGGVTSNRMLMGFIATTLKESHEKLAEDFVKAVEKYVTELKDTKQ